MVVETFTFTLLKYHLSFTCSELAVFGLFLQSAFSFISSHPIFYFTIVSLFPYFYITLSHLMVLVILTLTLSKPYLSFTFRL
ncbi:hypothetical protein BO78DRAFT_109951 [Aspergillus sclerotiicarbonarius CBS 121057]|uniref:Uncharacterized protein n=1 Tax=Aspergillus sclerotiicarbonarius (strain CBS 121057 / IBT 28362) TaxID=1448318 RepID=A0A319FHR0_ASPSB|nr:hypothetical protein BO78DRAFT_109951 [Aspergillus sclerotiicarbonarius CBS 121057]